MSISVAELARRLDASCRLTSDILLERLAALEHARRGDLSFVPSRKYHKRLRVTGASAVILGDAAQAENFEFSLLVRDPLVACARAAQWLPLRDKRHRVLGPPGDRYREPLVGPGASVHSSVAMGQGVVVGANTRIEPGCVLGDGVRVGDYCRIGPYVTLSGCASLGNRVFVNAGTVIGMDAFAYVRDGQSLLKVPSFGGVSLGDDVELGANCTVARGVLHDTTIATGVKLDNHVHLGHDVSVGRHTVIAAHSGVAGGTAIGGCCQIGGAVGVAEGLYIADGVRITAMSMVTKSVLRENESVSSGWPAGPSSAWWRQLALLKRHARRMHMMRFGAKGR